MNDTIAAVSTAYGRGGIAVIRISGERAIETAGKMFVPAGSKKLSETVPNGCVYGRILLDGEPIDDGMCTVFRAPHSFTGEDVAEISCHGGILITEKVLRAAFMAGARPAEAGEFTRRAFLSGKLSLSQAEAIGMIIDAETDAQLTLASSQQRGVFRKKADDLYEALKQIVTSVYAAVDFPEEDLAELSSDEIRERLTHIQKELLLLEDSWEMSRAVMEGIPTVIAGKPNTGKSSLLNALLGRERAIVTEVAGTTRDTLEETVACGRVLLRLVDTAGIHATVDMVEKLGVERSLKAIDDSELVLAVFDGTKELEDEDFDLIARLKDKGKKVIALINKCDCPAKIKESDLTGKLDFAAVLSFSAKNGEGLDRLKNAVENLYRAGSIDYNGRAALLNARQHASVSQARIYVERALDALQSGVTPDTAGFDLEAALSELAELDGRRITEEIVDDIFHRFCVGK